jgi:hypothetical protein
MRLAMTILTCRDITMVLFMTVDAAQGAVFLLTIGKLVVYALMAARTHVVGNLLPVLDIGG